MLTEEIAPAVAISGFSRIIDDIREQVDFITEDMVHTGKLVKQEEQLVLS